MTTYSKAMLNPDSNYTEPLRHDLWVMDDHRWAFFAWEKFRVESGERGPFSLVHADYHFDGCNDFSESEYEDLQAIQSLEGLGDLVRANRRIRKDSFIAPAVIRGLLEEVHFYCLQEDTEPGPDYDLLRQFCCRQTLYETVDSLRQSQISRPIIFDLCLDLFNRSEMWEEGDLWIDSEICEFLETVSGLIGSARMVTLSLSFGYSGSVDDTRHLIRLVLPKLVELRSGVGWRL